MGCRSGGRDPPHTEQVSTSMPLLTVRLNSVPDVFGQGHRNFSKARCFLQKRSTCSLCCPCFPWIPRFPEGVPLPVTLSGHEVGVVGGRRHATPTKPSLCYTIAFLIFVVYSRILENFHCSRALPLKAHFPVLCNFIATTIL